MLLIEGINTNCAMVTEEYRFSLSLDFYDMIAAEYSSIFKFQSLVISGIDKNSLVYAAIDSVMSKFYLYVGFETSNNRS